jgi:hypothetical protein
MTDEVLRARLRLLREEGVTYFEDGGMKIILGASVRPGRADDAPLTPLETAQQRASAAKDIDARLFGSLPGFVKG